MTKLQLTVLVEAKPAAVWDILTDPNYLPKLYRDILSASVDPPGRAAVGQWRTVNGRVGKRLIEFKTKVSELVPMSRFVVVGRRGGAFETFSEVLELDEEKEGTVVRATFDFTISSGYFGPGFDLLALSQAATLNQELYLENLKELAELKSLP